MRLPNLSRGVDRRSASTQREPGFRPSAVVRPKIVDNNGIFGPICGGPCGPNGECPPACPCVNGTCGGV